MMDVYETCSDAGRKSSVFAEKIICENCGKIKPCYNVPKNEQSSHDVRTLSRAELQNDVTCTCDNETYCQWIVRVVGFGPRKAKLADEHGELIGLSAASKEASKHEIVAQVQEDRVQDKDRSSKAEIKKKHKRESKRTTKSDIKRTTKTEIETTTVAEIVKSTSDPVVYVEEVEPDPPLLPPPDQEAIGFSGQLAADLENKAETEDHSISPRDSKTKVKTRKIKKKRVFRNFSRSENSSEQALIQERIRLSIKENCGLPISTATVFQTYRSRATYNFSPTARVSRPKIPLSFIKKSKTQINKQNSASSGFYSAEEDQGFVGVVLSSQPNSLSGNSYSWDLVPTLHLASGVEKTSLCPVQDKRLGQVSARHSFSYPQAQREYRRFVDDTMPGSFRSSSATRELLEGGPRSRKRASRPSSARSSSARGRSQSACYDRSSKSRKRSRVTSQCGASQYPMVLSSPSPAQRSRSHGRARTPWDPSPKIRKKPRSCPCACKWPDMEVPSKRLKAKIYGKEFSPKSQRRGRGCCRINCMGPCCLPVPRSEKRSSCFPTSSMPCGADNGTRHTNRLVELFERYNFTEVPSCGCPLRQMAPPTRSSFSVPPRTTIGGCCGRVKRFSSRSPGGGGGGCGRTGGCGGGYGLNFTQSSNSGSGKTSDAESHVCGKYKDMIDFSQRPSDKVCRCEFALAPHCIRRMGPRSTVTEYLSTIDPPKPRPRLMLAGSAIQAASKTSAAATSPQAKMSTVSASSSRASMRERRKNKTSKVNQSVLAEQANSQTAVPETSAPGTAAPTAPGTAAPTAAPTAAGTPQQSSPVPDVAPTDKTEPTTPAPAKTAEEKKGDDNNNYGTMNVPSSPVHSCSVSATRYSDHADMASVAPRFSSVPSQSFRMSSLDSGYSRHAANPYSTSSTGMPTSYSSAPYVRGPLHSPGYLHSAQDYRRSIRDYYDSKRRLSATSSSLYNNDTNLNAWHSTSTYERNTPQYQSVFPIYSSLREQSAKLGETNHREKVTNFVQENMQVRTKSPPMKKKHADVLVLKGNPKPKSKTPFYTPRKSFVEEKSAVDTMFQENWRTRLVSSENESKPLIFSNSVPRNQGGFTETAQYSPRIKAEVAGSSNNLHLAGFPANQEGIEKVSINGGEQNETEIMNCAEGTEGAHKTYTISELTNDNKQTEITPLTSGKESSVDYEPINPEPEQLSIQELHPWSSTVRKIEPRGAFFKLVVPESTSASSAPLLVSDTTIDPNTSTTIPHTTAFNLTASEAISHTPGFDPTASETIIPHTMACDPSTSETIPHTSAVDPTPSTTISPTTAFDPTASTAFPHTTAQSFTSTSNTEHSGQNVPLLQPASENTPAVPVFQSLMERFSESVQIFVRTKENTKDISVLPNKSNERTPDETTSTDTPSNCSAPKSDDAGGLGCCAVDNEGEHTVSAQEEMNVGDVDRENKSRNHVTPNCEATSDGMSWSELVNTTRRTDKAPTNCSSVAACEKNVPSAIGALSSSAAPSSLKAAPNGENLTPADGNFAADKQIYNHIKSPVQNLKRAVNSHVTEGSTTPSLLNGEKGIRDTKKDVSRLSCCGDEDAKNDWLSNKKQDTSVDPEDMSTTKPSNLTYVVNTVSQIYTGEELGQGENSTGCPNPKKSASEYLKPSRSFFWPLGQQEKSSGSSVDPDPTESSPVTKESILDLLKSKQPMFQKVSNSSSATVMAAKSMFFNRTKGEHTVNDTHNLKGHKTRPQGLKTESLMNTCSESTLKDLDGPFAGMMCRSFDNHAKQQEQKTPIRIGSLTEAMRKFISSNGTPV